MDADMKSFLYSAAFYHPLSDSVPISIQIYLRQKISICHVKNGSKYNGFNNKFSSFPTSFCDSKYRLCTFLEYFL